MLTSTRHDQVTKTPFTDLELALNSAGPDIRLPSSKLAAQQRSINLAISSRGIAALQAIDPAATNRFLETVIPMHGRMIHDVNGNLDSQAYDREGQVSNSFPLFILFPALKRIVSLLPLQVH